MKITPVNYNYTNQNKRNKPNFSATFKKGALTGLIEDLETLGISSEKCACLISAIKAKRNEIRGIKFHIYDMEPKIDLKVTKNETIIVASVIRKNKKTILGVSEQDFNPGNPVEQLTGQFLNGIYTATDNIKITPEEARAYAEMAESAINSFKR